MGVIRGPPLTMEFRRTRNRETLTTPASENVPTFRAIELPDKTRGKYAPRLLEKNTRESPGED